MLILSLDPSLTCFGYSVIDTETLKIIECGSIKSTKDKTLKASENYVERSKPIISMVWSMIQKYKIEKIYSETVVGSKSASALAALYFVKGLLIGSITAINSKLPLEFFYAKTVKKKLTGNINAEKDEIILKVSQLIPNWKEITEKYPKYKLEAVADAASIYLSTTL